MTNIAQDALNSIPVSISWRVKILTYTIDRKIDILASVNKIPKTTNNTAIGGGIIR
jgi:hypothetical protein